jgi:hypothetical protein
MNADCESTSMYQQGWEDGAEQERARIAKELGRLQTDGERLAYVRGLVMGHRLMQEGPSSPGAER